MDVIMRYVSNAECTAPCTINQLKKLSERSFQVDRCCKANIIELCWCRPIVDLWMSVLQVPSPTHRWTTKYYKTPRKNGIKQVSLSRDRSLWWSMPLFNICETRLQFVQTLRMSLLLMHLSISKLVALRANSRVRLGCRSKLGIFGKPKKSPKKNIT